MFVSITVVTRYGKSLETGAASIEIFVMLKFTEWPKTLGMTSKGNKLFAGDFRTNLNETNIDMFHFTKRWNWKWFV